MFTGIVAAVGRIERIDAIGDGPAAGVRLQIDGGGLPLEDVAIGDSIAIQGACMTVVARSERGFAVDVSRESLSRTAGLGALGEVNLEKALRLSDRLGGHLVSGHVDGVGEVCAFERAGESMRLEVRVPATLAKYVAYKGSIAIDGVSLTINAVGDDDDGTARVDINLIPHTLAVTTLKRLAPGARVNVEIDLLARYVERMRARECSRPGA
ncbi:MAG TPA: riboflavin synthase [Burkholderiaceae bacterium]|nr:riboflavin synthase [Burkholderiaceae bacterium]